MTALRRTDSISGFVRLERPAEFDLALLVVALHDVTYVDAPSRIVAERVYERISGHRDEIPFRLSLPENLPVSASYALKAEIRRSARAALRPGDYLSIAAHPWSPGETSAVIVVQQI